MTQYIDKDALVAEIVKLEGNLYPNFYEYNYDAVKIELLEKIKNFINTLEVKDPYEQIVQYDSIKDGLQAHAETYSFNIESILFHQLTKEQQKLWRKEIEQACISGGEMGVELARDTRYKEKLEVKDVDLEKVFLDEYSKFSNDIDAMDYAFPIDLADYKDFAEHFFELGLKAQKGE